MASTGQKRKGRPPKSEKGPATTSLAMRIRPEIYDEIRQDAEKHGRSISAQAERRVAYPEPDSNDLGRMIGIAVGAIERRHGKSWLEDDKLQLQCRAAVDAIFNSMLGLPALDDDQLQATLSALEDPTKVKGKRMDFLDQYKQMLEGQLAARGALRSLAPVK